ncbi:MAG: DUF2970 domain-containing protein [Janthinobacterium lividum]
MSGSFAKSMKAVFWSFFGVRKGRDHASDLTQLNPLHLVIAALIGAAVFIGILIVIVSLVTR